MANYIFTGFKNFTMQEVSFTSRIIPVSMSEYGAKIAGMAKKSSADYPWTLRDSAIGENVYTRGVCDCTSCLLTDGYAALLMHLDPENSVNRSMNFLRSFIRNTFGLTRPNLQAVVMGSKNTEKSQQVFNNFIDLLKEAKIPTSILKNSKSPASIAYKVSTDEVYISSIGMERELRANMSHSDVFKTYFEKVEISELDEIA
jgi:hypothetical protein